MLEDILNVLTDCVQLFIQSYRMLSVAVALSAISGVVLFLACWFSARLWNLKFHLRLQHKLCCAICGLLGFVLISLYCALGFLDSVTIQILDRWQTVLPKISNELPRKVFVAVDQVFPQGKPPSEEDGYRTYFPSNSSKQASLIVSQTTSEAVLGSLEEAHPFIFWILSGSERAAIKGMLGPIQQHIQTEWEKETKIFLYNDVIQISYTYIIYEIKQRVGRTVVLGRTILIVSFALMFIFTFGYVAWSATRDIRVHTAG